MPAPTITIPAAEANRSFSKLLRAVREGARVTITSHGEPVAELGPVGGSHADVEMLRRRKTRRELLEHLRTVEPLTIEPWTRDEIYEHG
jgi:prevent-host-death family protein